MSSVRMERFRGQKGPFSAVCFWACAVTAFFCAIGAPGAALAECGEVAAGNAHARMSYSVARDEFAFERIDLPIKAKERNSECELLVWLGPARTLTRPGARGDTLSFSLWSAAGEVVPPLVGPPAEASPLLLKIQADGSPRLRLPLQLRIAPGQFASAGRYRAELPIQLYERRGDDFHRIDDGAAMLRISVRVEEFVSIAVAGNSSIELGDLTAKDSEQTLQIIVVSNGAYRLTFKSDNRGRLQHETDSSSEAAIPYDLMFGGEPVDLEARRKHGRRFEQATQLSGVATPLTVRVRRVYDKRAGGYRDMLEVIVIAD